MLAVVGGGSLGDRHHSVHPVFRRGAAPEKIKTVPFGKLRVNSLKAATAGELGCLISWSAFLGVFGAFYI